MQHHYRVLAGALSLNEFTVAELADFSRTNPNTVRTVLAREKEWIELTGAESTGRPGGQFRRYRITEEGRRALTGRLKSLSADLEVSAPIPTARAISGVPAALLVAHDLLGRQYDATSDHTRKRRLLELVRTALNATHHDLDSGRLALDGEAELVQLHLQAIDALYQLERWNLGGEGTSLPVPVMASLHARLHELAENLASLKQDQALTLVSRAGILREAINKAMERTAVIDAIQTAPDELTPRVHDALETVHVQGGVLKLSAGDVDFASGLCDPRGEAASLCSVVVTMNSRTGGAGILRQIVHAPISGLSVFDVGYSAEVCDLVVQSKGAYYGRALDLSDATIRAAVRMTSNPNLPLGVYPRPHGAPFAARRA